MNARKTLEKFMSRAQLATMMSLSRGEEGAFFRAKMAEMAKIINAMPHSYATDGQGDQAIAYLHYFTAGADWYIVERDSSEDQEQAFGLAVIYEAELGYISIAEIIAAGAELDLHWRPRTLAEVRSKLAV